MRSDDHTYVIIIWISLFVLMMRARHMVVIAQGMLREKSHDKSLKSVEIREVPKECDHSLHLFRVTVRERVFNQPFASGIPALLSSSLRPSPPPTAHPRLRPPSSKYPHLETLGEGRSVKTTAVRVSESHS